MTFNVYPNYRGHKIGMPRRGCLRSGIVVANTDTESLGIVGHMAAVTHEEDGLVRYYVWTTPPQHAGLWVGPYNGLTEDIEQIDKEQE